MEGQHYLWVNTAAQRYYRLRVQRDLLGDLSMIRTWGSTRHAKGGMKADCVLDRTTVSQRIEAINKRRRRHGYHLVSQ